MQLCGQHCPTEGDETRTLACATRTLFATLLLSCCFLCVSSPLTADDDIAYRTALAGAVRAAANRVLPSVVIVETIGTGGPTEGEVEQDAPTSGVIIDAAGHILASRIVVERPSASILIVLADGSRHTAKVVAKDQHRDLVLLKITTDRQLEPVELGGNPELPIGATTIAVGRYGNDAAPIISRGVLSARERLDGIALQTDARVSPAFYGGPLIDLYGNVLGILIPAVAEGGAPDATSWYDSGIAFAIPAEVIAKKIDRLIAGQDIQKGLIGIVAKSRDPIADGTEIAAVRTRSPAEAAGIKPGDEVISVAGTPVRRHQEIRQSLGSFDAGETIELKLKRDGKIIDVQTKLADSIPPLQPQRLGVIVSQPSDEQQTGVVVASVLPDSPAAKQLSVGDIIEKIGEAEISEPDSLRRQLISAEPEKSLRVTYRRDDKVADVEIIPTSIAGKISATLPESWSNPSDAPWTSQEIKLPDSANAAAFVAPSSDSKVERLGLLVLLIGPGESTPMEILKEWSEFASDSGVVVCAIAPETAERWQPKELEVVGKFAAAMMKKAPIDVFAVAVGTSGAISGGKATAADSMALAVAISQSSTFFGASVSAETRPPAIRLRENEPASSLQVLIPVESEDELPTWSAGIQSAGYPIVRGGEVDKPTLLNWVRLLQAI